MAHEIASACKCKLCGETIIGQAGLILDAGLAGLDPANQRTAQFTLRLADHVIRKHPHENKALETKALEFLGMLRLANYATSDRGILEQRDFLRWTVHQATLNGRLSDEKLTTAAVDFAGKVVDLCVASLILQVPAPEHVERVSVSLKAQAAETLAEILNGLREIIEEPGRYQVTAPAALAVPQDGQTRS